MDRSPTSLPTPKCNPAYFCTTQRRQYDSPTLPVLGEMTGSVCWVFSSCPRPQCAPKQFKSEEWAHLCPRYSTAKSTRCRITSGSSRAYFGDTLNGSVVVGSPVTQEPFSSRRGGPGAPEAAQWMTALPHQRVSFRRHCSSTNGFFGA